MLYRRVVRPNRRKNRKRGCLSPALHLPVRVSRNNDSACSHSGNHATFSFPYASMRVGCFTSPSAPPAYVVWRMEIGLRAAVSYSPSASSVASHSSERVAFLSPFASRSTLGTCPFRMHHSKSVEVAYYWISHNTAKMHYRCHLSLFFFTRSAFPFACYHLRCTCNFLHQTLFVIIDSG